MKKRKRASSVTQTSLADLEARRVAYSSLGGEVVLHARDVEREQREGLGDKKKTALERTLQHIADKARTHTASPEELALLERLGAKGMAR